MEFSALTDWDWQQLIYSLEGDSPSATDAYEKIETMRAAIRAGYTPTLNLGCVIQDIWVTFCLGQNRFPQDMLICMT